MFQRPSLSMLSRSERLALRPSQWSYLTYTAHFHTSRQWRAADAGSDRQGQSPSSQQNHRRPRQQRAAKVSDAVQALSRDMPTRSVRGDRPTPNYRRVRSKTIDAQTNGRPTISRRQSRAGRMRENMSSGREGPNAQGLGRVTRSRDEQNISRSVRSAGGATTGPAQGGARLVDTRQEDKYDDDPFPDEEDEDEDEDEEDDWSADYSRGRSPRNRLSVLEQFARETTSGVPFRAEPVSKEVFLHLGQNGSTIAAGNHQGVIEDRITLLAEPTQDASRHHAYLATKMVQGQVMRFESADELARVNALAANIAKSRACQHASRKGLGEANVNPEQYDFAPLPEALQTRMVDELVRGHYIAPGASRHKQPLLNEIDCMTRKNATYLSADGERFLSKVRSLLPSQAAKSRQRVQSARK